MRFLGYLLVLVLVALALWFFVFGPEEPSATPTSVGSDNSQIVQTAGADHILYTNSAYGVSLFYPQSWQADQPTGISGGGEPVRFSGDNGYFSIDVLGGVNESLDQIIGSLTTHRLGPYGSNPRVVKTQVAGQEAAYIFPSDDQPQEARNEAVLLVRYQNPVEIEILPGVLEIYSFFALYADKGHVESIGETLVLTK